MITTKETQKKLIEKKKNIWLQPISKKKLILKLIPFMLFTLLLVGFVVVAFVIPNVFNFDTKTKNSMMAFGPIILILFSPFDFYFFDKAYCQYNLKHNEKMKLKISKVCVPATTDNGCFALKEIYRNNPNQLAWDLKQEKILESYKKWDPESFEKDIKYFRDI